MSDPKEKPTCPYCGSDDVSCDGTARYDVEQQDWVLTGTFDGGHCSTCDQELKRFVWVKVTP